ncbi:hypothetical protein CEXT_415851 [Caerostris extrusa]|uniref:Uncharacterized protein n=1 Tax=Caerostris extrusa TaxID=172846 RepID=A0AAV4XZF3_CAEEX|nr:hypothetical protein CEXT_415851 [Caerostris extrusa]
MTECGNKSTESLEYRCTQNLWKFFSILKYTKRHISILLASFIGSDHATAAILLWQLWIVPSPEMRPAKENGS